MATFSVLKLDTPEEADQALNTIQNLACQHLNRLNEHKFEFLTTNHSKEQEDALREAFAEEEE